MNSETIDTAMAKRMVEASAISGASIIGQAGGWSVMLKLGVMEKPLGAQRSDKPRVWRSLDRCMEYLRTELHIARIDLLDATHFSAVAAVSNAAHAGAAARLRNAHQAAAHDRWFREQIDIGVAEADDPGTQWVDNDEANDSWAKKRALLLKRVESSTA